MDTHKAIRGRLKLKNKASIIIIIAILVALSGCEETVEGKGTKGIEIKPELYTVDGIIYENQPLSIEVEARNMGYYDAAYGKIILRGYDREILPFKETLGGENKAKKNLPDLPRRNEYSPEGGFDVVEFEIPENHIRLPYDEPYEPTLTFTSCYFYQTQAAPAVCIVPRPGELTHNSPCQPETINLQSQGAPIAVTKIEQEIKEGFTRFIATIENVGEGRVISPATGSYDNCPTKLSYEDVDKVEVEMSIPGAPPPECTKDGKVTLENDVGKISCEFQISPDSFDAYTGRADATPFTQQLTVNVDYHYMQSVNQQLKVSNRENMRDESSSVDRPGLIDDGKKENGEGDEGGEEESKVSDASSSPCNCEAKQGHDEPDKPCVCLFYDGKEVFCHREGEPDVTFAEKNPKFRVYASSDNVEKCKISGHGSANCGDSVEHNELKEGEIKDITISGYDDGERVASQNCKIKREKS
ncbi:MAG: hypothetical protein ACOCZQ_00120 [Nanoarchaeota archaeon]